MAKTLEIVDYDGTTLVDLISGTNYCEFVGESGRRHLKNSDGTITRTFTFVVTAATKALVRTAANTFIASLRNAIFWDEDIYNKVSIFLEEGADGETAVRSLIKDFDAYAAQSGTAVDGYQTKNKQIFVDVVITIQDHREETGSISLSVENTPSEEAVGTVFLLSSSGAAASAPSRLNLELSAGSGSLSTKLWAGMMPSRGTAFQAVWEIAEGTVGTDTTPGAPDADTHSAALCTCTFATSESMVDRYTITVADVYDAAGLTTEAEQNQARGSYMVLCRARVNGTGTILMRGGISGNIGGIEYKEPVLLTSDGEFHFVPLGVFDLPPHGFRAEPLNTITRLVSYLNIKLAAQRLTGTATLSLDTLTWIPYESFLSATVAFGVTKKLYILTHENMQVQAIETSSTDVFTGYDQINEIRNWKYPIESRGVSSYVMLVLAAEHVVEQTHDEDLILSGASIYPAHEAYNG